MSGSIFHASSSLLEIIVQQLETNADLPPGRFADVLEGMVPDLADDRQRQLFAGLIETLRSLGPAMRVVEGRAGDAL